MLLRLRDEVKMETKNLIWVLIGVVLVSLVISMAYRPVTGGVTAKVDATGKLDTAGWTADEKMNYEMHGQIPARVKGVSSAPSGSGMVGGC